MASVRQLAQLEECRVAPAAGVGDCGSVGEARASAAMKPDKPTHPARDRDILRARNVRQLKPSSSSAPLSSGEESKSRCEPLAAPPADTPGAGPSSAGEEGRGAEMRVYLEKLRQLVPYVPRSGRLSRVQLIHSAIDYITDLQESLEARARRKLRDKQDEQARPPLAALPRAQVETNSSRNSGPLADITVNRLPTALETNTSHPAALAVLASSAEAATAPVITATSRRPMSPAAPGPSFHPT
ncbi:uncharacterized protein [Procambarus clarkii]|uniref:uncharacterized protein n=1 Tax=Procambarus clarkii TaxID=6728 RepID=UPI003742D7F0